MRDNRRRVEGGVRWILEFVNGLDEVAHAGSIVLLMPDRQRKSRVQSVLNFGDRLTTVRAAVGRARTGDSTALHAWKE